MAGFLQRTKRLIEDTYRDNGNRPVHLVGHSNGPLYAQYLLTHTTRAWRDKYIHGFTPIAGNFPGQGVLYPVFFTGLNIQDFTFPATQENAESSARMYLSAPSSYMSAADPRIFGDDRAHVRERDRIRVLRPRGALRGRDHARDRGRAARLSRKRSGDRHSRGRAGRRAGEHRGEPFHPSSFPWWTR